MSQSCASSSEMSSKVCGCGERLLILKASTVQNKGRLFWRCRNWATNSHCNYFEWVDDEESDFQGKETESEASGGKRVDGGKKGLSPWLVAAATRDVNLVLLVELRFDVPTVLLAALQVVCICPCQFVLAHVVESTWFA
ncbi:hypothetical protein DEO72_LG6g532 [Vigna unguiculata]|uniref:GRF-type domain-containing protein n=1 Tax=Vigna unguiculata TaxID=3917 RepID=A0A4D6M3V2_VIGUN|nr:hypothetical protein DEO72_LG6g532 [Vigna unguiculata]